MRQDKKKWGGGLKKLPDAQLELMLIIWDADRPVTRAEIEEKMDDIETCCRIRCWLCCPVWKNGDL